MSREIKFRAWGENIKEYMSQSFDGEVEIANVTRILGDLIDQGNWVIEQYTGLKDKNGKEIYEGDILQIYDHILGDFVVVWHNFGWKIKRSVGYESLSVHKSEDCTVIGNIHENPELVCKCKSSWYYYMEWRWKMAQELYKELTLKDIDKELELFGLSEETREKIMEWAEKKALADYVEGKWRFV